MWGVCANKTKRFGLMDIVLLPVSEGHGCPLNVLSLGPCTFSCCLVGEGELG